MLCKAFAAQVDKEMMETQRRLRRMPLGQSRAPALIEALISADVRSAAKTSEAAMNNCCHYVRECLDIPQSMRVPEFVIIDNPCIPNCHFMNIHRACDEEGFDKSKGECAGRASHGGADAPSEVASVFRACRVCASMQAVGSKLCGFCKTEISAEDEEKNDDGEKCESVAAVERSKQRQAESTEECNRRIFKIRVELASL